MVKLHFLTVISATLVLLGGVFLPSTGDTAEAYLSRYPKGTFAAPALVKPAVKVFPKKAGQVFRDCSDCPEMVVIPAGSFQMGDLNGGGGGDEKPVHLVTIPNAFAVGKYEVTFTEWDACVSAGGCNGLHQKDRDLKGWGRDSRPVINVSWNDAKEYVGWLSRKTGQEYRLPSESEWEYAARAGTGTKWSCGNRGDCLEGVAWYAEKNGSRTHPVGQKGANGFGLYDMHGNVSEWVEDCKQSYSGTPTDGSAQTGPDSCDRVNRGGSWYSKSRLLRAAKRSGYFSRYSYSVLGFRLARTLAPAPAASDGTNMDALFRRPIQAGGDIEFHEAYLSRYPKGTFAAPALVKIDKLKQQKQLAAADPPKSPPPPPVKPAVKESPKKAGQVFSDCGYCPEMVVVPAGSFQMGDSSGGGGGDEKPVHQVTIPNAFAVGKYEVTFAEWDACVSDDGCNRFRPKDKGWRGWGRGDRPVIYVGWNDAKGYVDWLSRKTGQEYRLLSESEWEYAARAGTGTKWSCGNKGDCLGDVAWYSRNSDSKTQPVGQKGANGFGLYDMYGNVWEWVEDCKQSYRSTPSDGSAQTGSDSCVRVLRGGSWYNSSGVLRAANRGEYPPGYSFNVLGFRIARILAPVKIDKLKQQKQLAAASPKPKTPLPVKPDAKEFPKKAGQVFRDCSDCPEMVVIPAGNFRMGDLSGDGGKDAQPVHDVTISKPFAAGKFEVTRGEFAAFADATGHGSGDGCFVYSGSEWSKDGSKNWRNPGYSQTGRDPVACVNWDDAQAYIDWLSRKTEKRYRLLSEAEWEYAARAGTSTKYGFGNLESGLCVYGSGADQSTGFSWRNKSCNDGYGDRTAPVGSFKANRFGLHDMHGNVWERVGDCWNVNYDSAPTDGSVWSSGDCSRRVLRGGSWDSGSKDMRSAIRSLVNAGTRDFLSGFRLARTFF